MDWAVNHTSNVSKVSFMLLLDRQSGESIILINGEDNIVIKLLDANEHQLKIGISGASNEEEILRNELLVD